MIELGVRSEELGVNSIKWELRIMGVASEKSRRFAVGIVRLYQYLYEQKNEYVMSKRLLRAGTSIGANLAEAEYAFSRKEFLSKTYIALKEVSETMYWLDLLRDTDYLSSQEYDSIHSDALELRKLLSSITKTTRSTPPS